MQIDTSNRWTLLVKRAKLCQRAAMADDFNAKATIEARTQLKAFALEYSALELHKCNHESVPELELRLLARFARIGSILDRHIDSGFEGVEKRRAVLDIRALRADTGNAELDHIEVATALNVAHGASHTVPSIAHENTTNDARELIDNVRSLHAEMDSRITQEANFFGSPSPEIIAEFHTPTELANEIERVAADIWKGASAPQQKALERAAEEFADEHKARVLEDWTDERQPTESQINHLLGRLSPAIPELPNDVSSRDTSPTHESEHDLPHHQASPTPSPVRDASLERMSDLGTPDVSSPASFQHALFETWKEDRQPTYEEIAAAERGRRTLLHALPRYLLDREIEPEMAILPTLETDSEHALDRTGMWNDRPGSLKRVVARRRDWRSSSNVVPGADSTRNRIGKREHDDVSEGEDGTQARHLKRHQTQDLRVGASGQAKAPKHLASKEDDPRLSSHDRPSREHSERRRDGLGL